MKKSEKVLIAKAKEIIMANADGVLNADGALTTILRGAMVAMFIEDNFEAGQEAYANELFNKAIAKRSSVAADIVEWEAKRMTVGTLTADDLACAKVLNKTPEAFVKDKNAAIDEIVAKLWPYLNKL